MATAITNYQCPACTGPLHFAAGSGKLECEYCGSSFDVAEIEARYAQKEAASVAAQEKAEAQADEAQSQWDTSGLTEDWGADAATMKTYNCPSCGAELICDEATAATQCPYCGNPSVVPGQFSGALRPDYVIPFKITKAQALDALKAHYKGKLFLPGAFTSQQQLDKIQGIYVPFWLFDGKASGECTYNAAKINIISTPSEETTVTRHYRIRRGGSLSFEKIPVDASSKMPDAHMDSIEPFDYGELKPFSSAYLPGFLADKYDMAVDDCQARADQRCETTFEAAMENTVTGYDTCTLTDKQIRIQRGKVHYALLPVWLLHVKWADRSFLFAVNGQTGRLVGDLPVSKAKLLGFFAALAVSLSAAASLLVRLLIS